MTNRSKSHAVCVAACLALLTVSPASAYSFQNLPTGTGSEGRPGGDERDPIGQRVGSGERASTGRISRQRQRQQAAPAAPTAEENIAAAQTFLTSKGVNCQVTEATFRGQTATGDKLYEATCANDFGYLALISETAPMTLDCMEISESQKRALAADPAAQVGPKCEMPANENFMAILTQYAVQAQVPCTINEANIIGKRGDVNVYEVGCDGADGYQINKKAQGGWDRTSCFELVSANVTCNFTTKDEQIATFKSWTAGSDAAACNISDVRYMGGNANGAFYEAACTGADGIIARLNTEKAVQQVYPCAEAAQIGGGCKLTAGAPQGGNAPTS